MKAHSSLGVGESLHGLLGRIYRKDRANFPDASPVILLKIAVKAMKDTIGENGLVPSLLVFGIIPHFPIISTEIPSQCERGQILSAVQMEMNAVIAERCVLAALIRNIPPASDRAI